MRLPAPPISDKIYTKEEYFELAEQSKDKLEYHNGRIVMMAGAADAHNSIVMNCIYALGKSPSGCTASNSDQAVNLASFNRYVYPDLSYTCGDKEFESAKKLGLINPSLLIEVLSEGTSEFDRTEKFIMYRSLPSFQEYILIDS